MKFLVEYKESREVLEHDSGIVSPAFLFKVLSLFSIKHHNIKLKKWDSEWQEFFKVKDSEELHDKSKLKCIIMSTSIPDGCSPSSSMGVRSSFRIMQDDESSCGNSAASWNMSSDSHMSSDPASDPNGLTDAVVSMMTRYQVACLMSGLQRMN